MAGDWIKIEHGIERKPEVLAMSESLGLTPFDVVGRLVAVWCWFDSMTENGNAGCVTKALLNRYVCNADVTLDFAAAMEKVGWLTVSDDNFASVSVPNWDRHNSKSAKTRALTRRRVEKVRNASSVTTSSLLCTSNGEGMQGKGNRISESQRVVHNQELGRVEKAVAKILNSYDTHERMRDKDKTRLNELRARREELKEMLGVKV